MARVIRESVRIYADNRKAGAVASSVACISRARVADAETVAPLSEDEKIGQLKCHTTSVHI